MLELLPKCIPSTYHAYEGPVPPLTAVAVKLTGDPAQLVSLLVVMLTDGTTVVVMVIITLLLAAVLLVAQVAFEVRTHQTESLLANETLT